MDWCSQHGRTSRRLMAVVAAVTAGILAEPVSAAGRTDRVVDCRASVDFNLVISSARNMTCGQARRDMRRHRGSIARTFRTPGGFRCTQVSGVPTGGQWRCVKRSRAYRFEFAD